jgi:hypothetical protein
MSEVIEIHGTTPVTPEIVATLFWNMDSEQQADFFATLERIAGVKLCMQMAYVVDSIVDRADRGERDAQNGFQTMLAHAQAYRDTATDRRVFKARQAIRGLHS